MEDAKSPRAEIEIVNYPLDSYMRIEWHLQRLRLEIMRLTTSKAKDRLQLVTRSLQHEAFLELISDPHLRHVMILDDPPTW